MEPRLSDLRVHPSSPTDVAVNEFFNNTWSLLCLVVNVVSKDLSKTMAFRVDSGKQVAVHDGLVLLPHAEVDG